MHNKQKKSCGSIVWKQFSNKGWCAFASLRLQVCIGVLSAATLTSVTPVQAEDTRSEQKSIDTEGETLNEIQVSGTMSPLTLLQSARIVSVLSREDIQASGVQSVNDLLKLASGVDVRQRGGFGIQTDISLDGGTFEQLTLLLNGVNISNPQTGHLSADLPISLADIERIEILSGASSRVYGGSAFGGCINIVTHKDEQSNLNVGADGGMHATIQGDARIALKTGSVGNRLSMGGGRSSGGTDNSDWRKMQLFYQGDVSHEQFNLNWQFGFSKKNYGANTFYSASYPNQYERNERYSISVGAETKGRLHFTPSVYWNRNYDNFELVKGERFGENFHQVDVYGLRLAGHIAWKLGTTAMGAEVRNEGILSTNLGRPLEDGEMVKVRGEKEIKYDHKDNRTNVSYNFEHNLLFDHWTLSAGVIANMNTSVDHRFRLYPGIDIAYRPTTNWKIYASYSKGFRLPTFTDLYYKSPTLNGNVGLRPEENRSTQLGVQYRCEGICATLRAFYHRGHGMIDWVMYSADDIYHSTSFDLDNLGVQAEGKIDFTKLLNKDIYLRSLSIGYTYIHQYRHDDIQIFRSNYALEYLRHKFTASLHHKVVSRLSATWFLRWQDRMGGYVDAQSKQLVSYAPYATLDLKIQWDEPKWTIYVQATNLTNKRYYDLGNVRQPGFWVLAGARVKLNL